MKKIFFAVAFIALGFTSASAQYGSTPHSSRDRYRGEERHGGSSEINYLQREARQQITAGINRGTLSRREAHALMNRYERIEAKERDYTHRGRLSQRETRILREDLERLMADTHRMSNRRGDGWARDRRDRY
jgi:Spy/CpxP family protein refolding chaperone